MKDTSDLLAFLNNTNNTRDLDNYLSSIDNRYPDSLSSYLKMTLNEKNVSPSELIKRSRIERTYFYQILNGRKKPGRDKVISIALALSLSLEETQRILTLAEAGVLYPKSKRDSVLIFALNNHYSIIETNLLLNKYNEVDLI